MMENKSTFDNAVALIRYRPDTNSLPQALNLCQGLQGVSSKTQILIKPNLVFWEDLIKANRSNPKIRSVIPIPGCPPTIEDLVKILRENGVEIDMEDYHRYRKHLVERYQSKPQFDPKDFFE